jgi:ArsR family transcriptional regulator
MNNFLISETVDFLKVLGDKTRLSILQLLKEEEKSAAQLEDELDKSQSTISQHISILKDANLINSNKNGRVNYYHIKSAQVFRILSRIKSLIIKKKKEKLDSLEKIHIDDLLL